jgi:hypothetical protein
MDGVIKNNVPRRKHSPEVIAGYVTAWRESGQSQRDFCRQQGIKYGTFKDWMFKSNRNNTPTTKAKPKDSFVSIQLDTTANRPAGSVIPVMEITFANGSQLSFYQPVSVDYLRDLLK